MNLSEVFVNEYVLPIYYLFVFLRRFITLKHINYYEI